jgi:hypothetical protein
MGHWRNQRWGWNQRHIWLFVHEDGGWWVYTRTGTGEKPKDRWRHRFDTEDEARAVVDELLRLAEQVGDRWGFFTPQKGRDPAPGSTTGTGPT